MPISGHPLCNFRMLLIAFPPFACHSCHWPITGPVLVYSLELWPSASWGSRLCLLPRCFRPLYPDDPDDPDYPDCRTQERRESAVSETCFYAVFSPVTCLAIPLFQDLGLWGRFVCTGINPWQARTVQICAVSGSGNGWIAPTAESHAGKEELAAKEIPRDRSLLIEF
jgi:hypothetical protein